MYTLTKIDLFSVCYFHHLSQRIRHYCYYFTWNVSVHLPSSVFVSILSAPQTSFLEDNLKHKVVFLSIFFRIFFNKSLLTVKFPCFCLYKNDFISTYVLEISFCMVWAILVESYLVSL